MTEIEEPTCCLTPEEGLKIAAKLRTELGELTQTERLAIGSAIVAGDCGRSDCRL